MKIIKNANVVRIIEESPKLRLHFNISTRDLQELMNDVYCVWQSVEGKYDKHDIIDAFTEYHRMAVVFGNLNYQVCNGGFSQWIFNGYCLEDIIYIYRYLNLSMKKDKYKDNEAIKILVSLLEDYYSDVCDFESYGTISVDCEDCEGFGYYEDEDEEETCDCYNCNGTGSVESSDFSRDYTPYDSEEKSSKYYEVTEGVWIDLFQNLINDYELITK